MFQAIDVSRIGRKSGLCHTRRAPSCNSRNGWRAAAGGRVGSFKPTSNSTALIDSIAASTKALDAPVHDTKAPANAGPAANAVLRASSNRPLACAN